MIPTAFSTIHICAVVFSNTNIVFLIYFSVGFFFHNALPGSCIWFSGILRPPKKKMTRENEKADITAPPHQPDSLNHFSSLKM